MAISEFRTKEQWLGTGLLTDYTFDFTIQDATHILLILQDASGLEVARFRGNDNTYLSGIVFDAKNGGGTVSLLTALTDQYVITALLAPDEPTQPSEFKSKFNFTLELFELALDRIVCQIQRLAYFAGRSLKLHDLDDITLFNMTMPKGVLNNAGATLIVSEDGTGIGYGATMGMIANAQGYSVTALAAQTAALASAAAAAVSAAAAAASAAAATCNVLTFGTRAAPVLITAVGGITSHSPQEEMQISLVGTSDATPVGLTNGNGLSMNGDITLGSGDFIQFIWDGVIWTEMNRRR